MDRDWGKLKNKQPCVLPVVVVNLTITLAGKLLLVCKCSDGLDTCQTLTEMSVHRRAGRCITSLQLHIGAAVVLLEEEVHDHEGNHACITVTMLSNLLGQKDTFSNGFGGENDTGQQLTQLLLQAACKQD